MTTRELFDDRKKKTVLLTIMRDNPRQVEVETRKRKSRGCFFEGKGAKGAVEAGLGKGAVLLRARGCEEVICRLSRPLITLPPSSAATGGIRVKICTCIYTMYTMLEQNDTAAQSVPPRVSLTSRVSRTVYAASITTRCIPHSPIGCRGCATFTNSLCVKAVISASPRFLSLSLSLFLRTDLILCLKSLFWKKYTLKI